MSQKNQGGGERAAARGQDRMVRSGDGNRGVPLTKRGGSRTLAQVEAESAKRAEKAKD